MYKPPTKLHKRFTFTFFFNKIIKYFNQGRPFERLLFFFIRVTNTDNVNQSINGLRKFLTPKKWGKLKINNFYFLIAF